ncbi:MAG: hypothetical protein ABIJ26_00900 [Candidatus Margulisiibacteriota bacterium]
MSLNFITTGAAFTGPVRYAGSFMGLALDGRGNVFTYDRIARKLLKLNYTIGQVRVVSELPFSDGISAIAIGRKQTLVCAASGASTIDLVAFRQTQ